MLIKNWTEFNIASVFLIFHYFQSLCIELVTQILDIERCNSILTPVPPIIGRGEQWPLFHFWRHHLWPNLASSILNFCRRKRSFQWYPDQSDRLHGAWNMHENPQKFEWKTQSKISFGYSMVKIARLDDAFSEFFELEASPVEVQSLQQKDKKRRKRKGDKK